MDKNFFIDKKLLKQYSDIQSLPKKPEEHHLDIDEFNPEHHDEIKPVELVKIPVDEKETIIKEPNQKTEQTLPVESAHEDVAAMNIKLQRVLADLDNMKKHYSRDLDRQRVTDLSLIFSEFLPVIDNMERGLRSFQWKENKNLYMGIKANYELMLNFLRKFNVERFFPINEMFNPEMHQAVSTVVKPGIKDGKIVEVILPGYTISGQILRPAAVITVKNT